MRQFIVERALTQGDLDSIVEDLKKCGPWGQRWFDSAAKNCPQGIKIQVEPCFENQPENSTHLETCCIFISASDPRCTVLETLLVELAHLIGKKSFLIFIEEVACTMSRDKFIRTYEQLEWMSVRGAVSVWKQCASDWKCPKRCPTYEDPTKVLEMSFEEHFRRLAAAHKERIGGIWDILCGP